MHLGVHNCIQKNSFSPEQSPVERPGQRNHRGDYHQLLQASPAPVRRRHSSTWYRTLGVCRLRSRSRSRADIIVMWIYCCVVDRGLPERSLLRFWRHHIETRRIQGWRCSRIELAETCLLTETWTTRMIGRCSCGTVAFCCNCDYC